MCAHTNRANEEMTGTTIEDLQHALTDLEIKRVNGIGVEGVEGR